MAKFTLKIKWPPKGSNKPPTKNDFAFINAEDFDPEKGHELYTGEAERLTEVLDESAKTAATIEPPPPPDAPDSPHGNQIGAYTGDPPAVPEVEAPSEGDRRALRRRRN